MWFRNELPSLDEVSLYDMKKMSLTSSERIFSLYLFLFISLTTKYLDLHSFCGVRYQVSFIKITEKFRVYVNILAFREERQRKIVFNWKVAHVLLKLNLLLI